MKVDTNELSGKALVWAVSKALHQAPSIQSGRVAYRSDHGSWIEPNPTDDRDVVELMASERIGVERPSAGQAKPVWRAITDNKAKDPQHLTPVVSAFGATIGLAVRRALVLSRLGPSVEIPDVLLEPAARISIADDYPGP